MTSPNPSGIETLRSSHSVAETMERLMTILQKKGIKLFTVIDHSGEAEAAGMKMPPTKLVIFGNPHAGTPLMLAAPSSAIDLPLKILIAEDAQGGAWVSYNKPAYLEERHGLAASLTASIAGIEQIAAAICD